VAADLPGKQSVEPPTNVRTLILALSCGLSFILYLHRYSWAFVKKPIQDEFQWDNETLGWLDGLFGFSYGVGQVPTGMLGDWFGARVLLTSSVIAWSLALLAVTIAVGVWQMAAARMTFGVAQASCYPMLNKASKNWFPLGMRTTAQAWIATFFGRGGGAASFFLFGTVLLGWLEMPWRWALAVLALLGTASGVLFFFLFRNAPAEHPWSNAAEADLVIASDPQAVVASHSRLAWGTVARSRTMWFLFLRAFVSNMADVVFVYWLATYLSDFKGYGNKHAGWMAALPLIGGALGGIWSGTLQSNLIRRGVDRGWVRSGVGFCGKGAAAALLLASLSLDLSGPALAVAFLMVKFFTDWEQPAEWGTLSDIVGRGGATAFACVNTAGSLGGFVASPLVGRILDSYKVDGAVTADGWNVVFLLLALEYVIAASCWLFIDCRKPLDPTPAEA
jgi:ACS family glucarate transporter-like MFS transporter